MWMKLAAALLATLLPVAGFGQVWTVTSNDIGETAIVLDADDLRNGRLPRIIHERGIPPLFTSDIVMACLTVHVRRGDKVVYLPTDGRCVSADALPRASQRLAENKLKIGEGNETPVTALVLRAAPPAAPQALSCSCPPPTNNPPVASLELGGGQQVEADAVIETIRFFASDPDTISLNGSFTHRVNNGISVPGLPGGLVAACTPGSGNLTCDIDGQAPGVLGDYRITFTATDGNSNASAFADLEVQAAPPPVNEPPVASVEQGASQQVTSGQAIQAIRFLATDPDTDSLQDGFSFRFDGGAPVQGLPEGLNASCTAGAGSLDCEVTGLAPAAEGAYVIEFSASDGEKQATASATVNVEAPEPPPVNEPPVVTVAQGASQEAEPGAAIQTIRFTATDSDSEALAQGFSYRQDNGAIIPGLPAGLSAACTSGVGSLSCDVGGAAPGEPGNYVIAFTASDGELDAATSATLRVRSTAPVILNDGFEPAP